MREPRVHRGAVASLISHLTVDAHHAYQRSRWRSEVLDIVEDPDDPNLPGDEECLIISADGAMRLSFIEVPDDKVVKNRLHLDLRPVNGTRDDQLQPGRRRGRRQLRT